MSGPSAKVVEEYENSPSGFFVAHNAAAFFFICEKKDLEVKKKELYESYLNDPTLDEELRTEKEAKEFLEEVEFRELTKFELSLARVVENRKISEISYND